MHKIVIDANVWIRFARFQNLQPLLNRLDLYHISPIANCYLLSEVFEVLVEKNWMTERVAMKIVEFIGRVCVLTTENAVYRLSPDPKDNYLFDLAVQSNCAFIISDDTNLLSFTMQPVEVKSCNWFLKQFPV